MVLLIKEKSSECNENADTKGWINVEVIKNGSNVEYVYGMNDSTAKLLRVKCKS